MGIKRCELSEARGEDAEAYRYCNCLERCFNRRKRCGVSPRAMIAGSSVSKVMLFIVAAMIIGR